MSPDAMRKRLERGWGDDDAMMRPVGCPEWRWEAEKRLGYGVDRAIREMRAEGHTWAFIGLQLGASRETVRRVENGQ